MRFCRERNPDICFIQETHGENKMNFLWQSEWGNSCIFANGDSNSRGVAVLFGKGIKAAVNSIVRDFHGRYIICKIILHDISYCVANIYAPNVDDADFFKGIFNEIEKMECAFTIIGGDFNLTMDPELDRNGPGNYNPNATNLIKDAMESNNWCDIWRVQNPDLKRLTWSRHNRRQLAWSHIDYFIISGELVNSVDSSEIHSCILSDHSMISLGVTLSDQKRGPGIWKFNNQLLNDNKFCEHAMEVIQKAKLTGSHLDVFERWEHIKREFSTFSKEYSKAKTSRDKLRKYELYKSLEALQSDLIDGRNNHDLSEQILHVVNELDTFATQDAKRAAFRSRANFALYGERATKYYFNLEKINFVNKTMYCV